MSSCSKHISHQLLPAARDFVEYFVLFFLQHVLSNCVTICSIYDVCSSNCTSNGFSSCYKRSSSSQLSLLCSLIVGLLEFSLVLLSFTLQPPHPNKDLQYKCLNVFFFLHTLDIILSDVMPLQGFFALIGFLCTIYSPESNGSSQEVTLQDEKRLRQVA